jgi:hypothetical protein
VPSRRGNSTASGGLVNVDGEARRRWGSTRPLSALLRSASEVWIGATRRPDDPLRLRLRSGQGAGRGTRRVVSLHGYGAAPKARAAATSPETLRALPARALHSACARAHRRDRHRVTRPWAPKRGLRHRPLPHPLGRNHTVVNPTRVIETYRHLPQTPAQRRQ